jgi:hypothetical protein
MPETVIGLEDERWRCPWVLPVGREGREAVRAICVWPDEHGDDAEHIAVVDGEALLFGTDLGEKRQAES